MRTARRGPSAGKQDARLVGDLRQHWGRDVALAARAVDQRPELGNARRLLTDPSFDEGVWIGAALPGEEIDPELLEVAAQASGQQPLPLVARNEARDLLLRPIETKRFAEHGVSAGQGEFVNLATGRERGDPEDAVELKQA